MNKKSNNQRNTIFVVHATNAMRKRGVARRWEEMINGSTLFFFYRFKISDLEMSRGRTLFSVIGGFGRIFCVLAFLCLKFIYVWVGGDNISDRSETLVI